MMATHKHMHAFGRRAVLAAIVAAVVALPGITAGQGSAVSLGVEDPLGPYGLHRMLRSFELQAMDPERYREALEDGSMRLVLHGVAFDVVAERAPWEPSDDAGRARVSYVGEVAGVPGSRVLVTLGPSGVGGYVHAGEEYIWFEPVIFHSPLAPPGLSVVYHAYDAILKPDEHSHDVGDALPPGRPGSDVGMASISGPDRSVGLWVDSTLKSQTGHQDRVKKAIDTANSAWPTMLGWSFTYDANDLEECSDEICSATDSAGLLRQFADHVHGQGLTTDIATLFTGKDIVGALGAADQPGRYNFVQVASYTSDYQLALTLGHELAHNFNARHLRAEQYQHRHSDGVVYTHSTNMRTFAFHDPETRSEVFFELSGANRAWARGCNAHDWSGGSQRYQDRTGFGPRCWTGEANLLNGPSSNVVYENGVYRGKLFQDVPVGELWRMCIYTSSSSGSATIGIKPSPDGSAPTYQVTIPVTSPGWACRVRSDFYWTDSTMFIYMISGDVTLGVDYDTWTPGDGYVSTNNGASWTSEASHPGFRARVLKDTLEVDGCGVLGSGQSVAVHGHVKSCNQEHTLANQGDGNLVLYKGSTPIWASVTSGSPTTLVMQADGNLVYYRGSTVLWASNTAGNPGAWMRIRDDGVVEILSTTGKPLWGLGCGYLGPNAVLKREQYIRSCDGRFNFVHQGDGNLVLYQGASPLWASNTAGYATTALQMQWDGNLVLVNGNSPVWATGTDTNQASWLTVANNGTANVVTPYGARLWHTNTCCH